MSISAGRKPSVEVVINGKRYRDIQTLPDGKLEHLLQLARTQVIDYKRCYTDFEKQVKLKPALSACLENLEQRVRTIEGVIRERSGRQEA